MAEIRTIQETGLSVFKKDMQAAFQSSVQAEEDILPEADIDQALAEKIPFPLGIGRERNCRQAPLYSWEQTKMNCYCFM